MKRRIGTGAFLLLITALAAACGGSSGSASSASSAGPAAAQTSGPSGSLVVLAASSLKEVFPELADAFSKANTGAKLQFSFAGSDELATQIQEGAPADVYAAASPKYPEQLAAAGK